MEIFGGLTAIFAIIGGLLVLLMPLFIYLNQKYTWQCRNELRKNNQLIEQLINNSSNQNVIHQDVPSVTPPPGAKQKTPQPDTVEANCPGCLKKFSYTKEQEKQQGKCPHCDRDLLFPPFVPGRSFAARPI